MKCIVVALKALVHVNVTVTTNYPPLTGPFTVWSSGKSVARAYCWLPLTDGTCTSIYPCPTYPLVFGHCNFAQSNLISGRGHCSPVCPRRAYALSVKIRTFQAIMSISYSWLRWLIIKTKGFTFHFRLRISHQNLHCSTSYNLSLQVCLVVSYCCSDFLALGFVE